MDLTVNFADGLSSNDSHRRCARLCRRNGRTGGITWGGVRPRRHHLGGGSGPGGITWGGGAIGLSRPPPRGSDVRPLRGGSS